MEGAFIRTEWLTEKGEKGKITTIGGEWMRLVVGMEKKWNRQNRRLGGGCCQVRCVLPGGAALRAVPCKWRKGGGALVPGTLIGGHTC